MQERTAASICNEIGKAYGCLFCKTGKEKIVAENVTGSSVDVRAVTMRQMKYKSSHGEKCVEEEVALKGYVFFEAPVGMKPSEVFPKQHIIRILYSESGNWHLYGFDRRFAEWLFQQQGVLGISKAYREGAKVRIHSGPLKALEGKIRRIDKRGRACQVILDFLNKKITMWLGFEWIDLVRNDEIRE